MRKTIFWACVALLVLVAVPSYAADCTFTFTGTTMLQDADCTTDVTIGVPDGMTLDEKGNLYLTSGAVLVYSP